MCQPVHGHRAQPPVVNFGSAVSERASCRCCHRNGVKPGRPRLSLSLSPALAARRSFLICGAPLYPGKYNDKPPPLLSNRDFDCAETRLGEPAHTAQTCLCRSCFLFLFVLDLLFVIPSFLVLSAAPSHSPPPAPSHLFRFISRQSPTSLLSSPYEGLSNGAAK